METRDAISARRNVREYASREITEADLKTILEAGRRAPSSRNRQRWAFVVVRDRDRRERLSQVWRGAWFIPDAPVVIAIVAPPADDEVEEAASINFDLGQAVMAMMIAAADLGVGTGHASVLDWELGAEILGLPDEWRLSLLMGMGYPADRPLKPIKNPARRPFDEVVHWERWNLGDQVTAD